jgi:hypothetical protein
MVRNKIPSIFTYFLMEPWAKKLYILAAELNYNRSPRLPLSYPA